MRKNDGKLNILDYLITPNHYTLKCWYLSDGDTFDEVYQKHYLASWDLHCKENEISPFEDKGDEGLDFIFSEVEKDHWLIINYLAICMGKFNSTHVFLSALLDEMEFSNDDKEEIFNEILSGNNLYLNFIYFPRRIDLYPIRQPSIALQLYNELGKEVIKNLQVEY